MSRDQDSDGCLCPRLPVGYAGTQKGVCGIARIHPPADQMRAWHWLQPVSRLRGIATPGIETRRSSPQSAGCQQLISAWWAAGKENSEPEIVSAKQLWTPPGVFVIVRSYRMESGFAVDLRVRPHVRHLMSAPTEILPVLQ